MAKASKIDLLTDHLINIISETNGISLADTLELAVMGDAKDDNPMIKKSLQEFRRLINDFQTDEVDIKTLLNHPVASALFNFFQRFPKPYIEEHIHLTGSLSAEFIHPHLMKLLKGPQRQVYFDIINKVYGEGTAEKIETVSDVDHLVRLKEDEFFDRYLKILLLPKLILTTKEMHAAAAYHMASELYNKYNVGMIRLKFTLSRANQTSDEQIPGLEDLKEEDVVLGLYDGFMQFKAKNPDFDFVLSPCFRKEANFFDAAHFATKKEHFLHQVDAILDILDKYPFLNPYLCEVDTVGSEKDLYRKGHFAEMQQGFRKLHFKGFAIRSHHGETWHTLKKGVQAVDNALNIWHIDTLEHGLSLGINPNYYFHSLYSRLVIDNERGGKIKEGSNDWKELMDMDWREHEDVREKLFKGVQLSEDEKRYFVKIKFHTAREVEHYQHDVLNRMINKGVSLIALPSSNNKLTTSFEDYKDHPFSWWEKKGLKLGVGTDNYVTLNTNYIQELLILLFTDAHNLKITKLLMVATGETKRPYLSQLLWKMRGHEPKLHTK
jgi:adenosine deaminase